MTAPALPFSIVLQFLIVVVMLASLPVFWLERLSPAQKAQLPRYFLMGTRIGISLYLAGLYWVASEGWFAQFEVLPPRVLWGVLATVALMTAALVVKPIGAWLREIPLAALILLQVFRVWVELILWQLYEEKIIPKQMTYMGVNYDIHAGVLAVFVAILVYSRVRYWKAIAWGYTAFGLLSLANIVTVALLSAPTPLRAFDTEPANTVVAFVPFIWLPTFVVPMAAFLHVLAIIRLLRLKS